MQTAATAVSRILETLGCARPQLITAPSSPPALSERQCQWAAKWLGLLNPKAHPKLEALEAACVEFCRGIWQQPLGGWLLVLWGPNGTGKTHCLKAIRSWVQHVGASQIHVPEKNVVMPIQAEYRHWPSLLSQCHGGDWSGFEDVWKAPVLLLDEVGGGHDPSRVGVDKLCQILSQREARWTALTTNGGPEEWEQTFDRRVASRFLRNSLVIDTEGVPDYSVLKCTRP